jgi:hypothetical protein
VKTYQNDGFVKSPSAALRFNFVVAKGRGGSPSRPTSGNPADCPYHRICAPGIWSFLRNHQPGNKKTPRKFQAGFFSLILPSSAGVSEKSQIVTSSEEGKYHGFWKNINRKNHPIFCLEGLFSFRRSATARTVFT